MKIFIFLLPLVLLASCNEPGTITKKYYKTYSTSTGNLYIHDEIPVTLEGQKTTDLSFRRGGIISDIFVSPGDIVKKGQILAKLSNNESFIQESSLTSSLTSLDKIAQSTDETRRIMSDTIKSTKELYEKRIDEIDIALKEARLRQDQLRQQISNATGSVKLQIYSYIGDFERLSTTLLYSGDKILGITPQFDSANDSWDNYLGIRVGNSRKNAQDAWSLLYSSRGKLRAFTETGSKIMDMDSALLELETGYGVMRQFIQYMNHMLQNSVAGGGLPDTLLDGWILEWSSYAGDLQGTEGRFLSWKNSIEEVTKNSGSGTIADKNILLLDLEIEKGEQSKAVLKAEMNTKLQELSREMTGLIGNENEVTLRKIQTTTNLHMNNENKEYALIRAPYDGIILKKDFDEGSFVNPGNRVLQITSNHKKYIKTYIDNNLYMYQSGDTLEVLFDGETEKNQGIFVLIQEQKDPLHNKNYVELEIDTSGEIGTKGTMYIERKKSRLENGVIIPLTSIITRYGPPAIFVLGSDGRVKLQNIEVLGSDQSYAEVIGISGGVDIITEGKENLYDGEKVFGDLLPNS